MNENSKNNNFSKRIQEKDIEMINRIIKDDKQSREEFEAYLKLWEKSSELQAYEKVDAQQDWEKVRSRMKLFTSRKRIPLSTYFLRIAGVVVLAFGLAFFLARTLMQVSGDEANYFEIASTENTEVVELPDGTIITLNKNSKIIRNSNYGEANRDIILEGEAFFSVARNESLPFKVHTLNSTIEVLGTSFDIKAESGKVIVGVVSGKVLFYDNSNNDSRIQLTANNYGVYDSYLGELTKHDNFDQNAIAWHTHRFIFDRTPIDEVCSILADFYGLNFDTQEHITASQSIDLIANTESLDQIIKEINMVLTDMRLMKYDDDLVLSRL